MVGVSTMDLGGQRWALGCPGLVGVVLAHEAVGHRAQGLLTLHSLTWHAGINDEAKNIEKHQTKHLTFVRSHCLRCARSHCAAPIRSRESHYARVVSDRVVVRPRSYFTAKL